MTNQDISVFYQVVSKEHAGDYILCVKEKKFITLVIRIF